jgi:hypothetical protein
MDDSARIYRAVILRAVLGPSANIAKVDDLARLNRLCEHLADCEQAQRILKRKGYGKAGMTFIELACSVPDHVKGIFRGLLRSAGVKLPEDRSKIDEAFDIWTSR